MLKYMSADPRWNKSSRSCHTRLLLSPYYRCVSSKQHSKALQFCSMFWHHIIDACVASRDTGNEHVWFRCVMQRLAVLVSLGLRMQERSAASSRLLIFVSVNLHQ